jgi:two-component sensor histidine kinase
VLHAFPRAPGTITGRIVQEPGGELHVVVADDGQGLAPRDDSPGLGMGLGLIAEVANRIEIATDPGTGTEIRMWFRPDPGA